MVAFIVIAALLIDMEVTNVSDIINKDWLTSSGGIALFVSVSSIYLVGQLFILNFVEQKSKEMRIRARYFKTINTILRIGCFFLTAILLVVIFDVAIDSHYYTVALIAITTVSYGLAIIMMGFLMQRFFSWYRSNKDSIVVLLYGLSAASIIIYSVAGLIYFDIILLDKPSEIFPDSEIIFPSFSPDSSTIAMAMIMMILNHVYYYVAISSFVLMWAGTAVLLYNYSKRVGKVRYWGLISAPLIYFSGQVFVTLLISIQISTETLISDPTTFIFYYAIVFTVSSTVGGILFGIPFWVLANKSNNPRIRHYMTISALGVTLFFVSGSANVAHAPFPPFGLATVSLIGISSYFILVGIYSAAISVSEDVRIRLSIRRSALHESKLVDSIGSAEMEQEIQRKVMKIAKDNRDLMMEETGVESSLSEDEVKSYLKEVIEEIESSKRNNSYKNGNTKI